MAAFSSNPFLVGDAPTAEQLTSANLTGNALPQNRTTQQEPDSGPGSVKRMFTKYLSRMSNNLDNDTYNEQPPVIQGLNMPEADPIVLQQAQRQQGLNDALQSQVHSQGMPQLQHRSAFRQRMTNALQGMSDALAVNYGLPSSFEREQTRIRNQQAQQGLDIQEGYKNLQGQAIQAQLPRPLTASEASTLNAQFGTNTYTPGMMIHPAAIDALSKVALQNKGKTDAATINQGVQVPVPADIANKYGIAPGSNIGAKALSQLQGIEGKNVIKTSKMIDGVPHQVFQNRATGEVVHDNGIDSTIAINLAKAKAFANAKANVTPFTTFDGDGNLVTISAGQAIATGVPPAGTWNTLYGATGSTKSQAQASTAVAEHIPDFQKAVQSLAARGELGPVMGRLNTYLEQGYGGSDKDVAEFITTVGLLKSGAVRAHFGARGGQQMLARFDSMLNTAQTPEALLGSINAIDSFLKGYGAAGSNANTPRTSINRSKPSGSDAVGSYLSNFGNGKH